MASISNWCIGISSSRLTGLSLIGFLAFMVLVLPGQAERAALRSAGTGSPDTSFVYSSDDLYQMASAYGEEGRTDYIRERFTFDLVWPLVYTIFLATSTSWLTVRTLNARGLWRRANLVPLFAASADYLENAFTSIVMFRYPAETPVVAVLARLATLVKWLLVSGSFGVLLLYFILYVHGRVSRKGAA